MRYWVFDNENIFKQVDESKLDFTFKNNPPGMAMYTYRKPNKFCYVYYGKTKEQCWLKVTKYDWNIILEHQRILDILNQQFINKYGIKPANNE